MKLSEARILVFLVNAAKPLKNARTIAIKLNIDVTYLYHILDVMLEKKWLSVHFYNKKRFFEPKNTAPVKEAIELIAKENKETKRRCL